MFNRSIHYLLLLSALALPFCLSGEEPKKSGAKEEAAVLVKEGRTFFSKAQFAEAMRSFEKALDKDPSNKDTRVLAAVSAYWAHRPERALEYWNHLYEVLPRGGNDEWELQKNRVMALSALAKWEAAELAITRLREIRSEGKSPAARIASGFVREHFFGKGMRAGFWESFDERGESPTLWTVTVSQDPEPPAGEKPKTPPEEKVIATLAVEAAALPGGGSGFLFSEQTDEARRIYKYWTARPDYATVRALTFSVLQGKLKPISEKQLKPEPPVLAAEGTAVPTEIRALGLTPQAESIAFDAYRLNSVQADVVRLARIAPGDDAALDDYLREFKTKFPTAAATASELAELLRKAKLETVDAACEAILKFPQRGAYMEFALLTALNTRGRDIPSTLLAACAKSKDGIVRQTAALMLGQAGDKHGLEILFKEIESADALGCELVMGKLDELLGHVFDAPPNPQSPTAAEKLPAWKQAAAKWRAENLDALNYVPNAKPGEPFWIKK